MRHYEAGRWGVLFIFSLRGSVIPQALVWAVPNAILAAVFCYCKAQYLDFLAAADEDNFSVAQVWAGYNFLVGFLLTFRTQQAYARWWEGATLMQQARGEWFNAYSSLVAFSSVDKNKQEEVASFHHLLATLMSMLFGSACQQISSMPAESEPFAVLEETELDDMSMEFLRTCHDRVEVILLWIQRIIVVHEKSGVLDIAPPLLAMVFQELSRGVVQVNGVRKISEFLFPWPYAQLVTVVLLVHFVLSPIICGLVLENWYWAGLTSFISVFAMWSLNYVAAEIECPFGVDENDLPMHAMQNYMNRTLSTFLDPQAQQGPLAGANRKSRRSAMCEEVAYLETAKSIFKPSRRSDVKASPIFMLDQQKPGFTRSRTLDLIFPKTRAASTTSAASRASRGSMDPADGCMARNMSLESSTRRGRSWRNMSRTSAVTWSWFAPQASSKTSLRTSTEASAVSAERSAASVRSTASDASARNTDSSAAAGSAAGGRHGGGKGGGGRATRGAYGEEEEGEEEEDPGPRHHHKNRSAGGGAGAGGLGLGGGLGFAEGDAGAAMRAEDSGGSGEVDGETPLPSPPPAMPSPGLVVQARSTSSSSHATLPSHAALPSHADHSSRKRLVSSLRARSTSPEEAVTRQVSFNMRPHLTASREDLDIDERTAMSECAEGFEGDDDLARASV